MASSHSPPKTVIPSNVTDQYWVYSKERREHYDVDSNFVGKWMVFADSQDRDRDGLTQLDHFWFKIEENFKLFTAKVSTDMPNPNYPDSEAGVICCYTRDFRDKDDVKRNADKIRAILGPAYRSPMYYKSDEATLAGIYSWSHRGVSIYRHLIDGTFWKRDSSNNFWIEIQRDSSSNLWIEIQGKNYSNLRNIDFGSTIATLRNIDFESAMASRHSPKGIIPSKVTDDCWVYSKEQHEDYDEDSDFIGKWMVFADFQDRDGDGLTQLDHFWFKIEENFKDTELLSAKVSTAMPNPDNPDYEEGVICCYTRDFTDKSGVKRNADKIRAILGPSYRGTMYYKSEDATNAGKYSWSQRKGVSMYRHLLDGTFWERDSKHKWQLVN